MDETIRPPSHGGSIAGGHSPDRNALPPPSRSTLPSMQRPHSQSQAPSTSLLSAPTGQGHSRGSVARRKTVRDLGVGKPSLDEFGKPTIRNVFDLYKEVRTVCGMISNLWGWTTTSNPLAQSRMSLPTLVKVYNGGQVHVIPGFLIQDITTMNVTSNQNSHIKGVDWPRVHNTNGPGGGGGANAQSPQMVEVLYLEHPSPYFAQMVILLKLRWLLRLHSASCELDYKICSFKGIIIGLNYLVLQSHAELTADSGFEKYKVSRHVGSHVQVESLVDDIADQLQRSLGRSWRGFLEYVSTCDPNFTKMTSQMDMLQQSKVVSNAGLAQSLDCTFIAQFLRLDRRIDSPTRLLELYADMELLGMPLPEVPPLHGAYHLVNFVNALLRPSRKDREKLQGKQAEKLAQLDAVLLCHSIELKSAEVVARDYELSSEVGTPASPMIMEASMGSVAPTYPEAEEGDLDDGPPAAKVNMDDKPFVRPSIFTACVHTIQHHVTFPVGIRERLHHVLTEDFNLTQEQVERLTIGTTSNVQGTRLSEQTLYEIFHKEKTRLRKYAASYNRDTTHLLVPSLVSPPSEQGLPAKFHTAQSKLTTYEPPSSPLSGSLHMSRSLPSFSSSWIEGREPFKVPKGTGPLTLDPSSQKLRSTGFFIRMPPLD